MPEALAYACTPESTVGALSLRKRGELVRQTRDYSFDFYEWKKARAAQAPTGPCRRGGMRPSYRAKLGRRQRRAFWCDCCQRLHD